MKKKINETVRGARRKDEDGGRVKELVVRCNRQGGRKRGYKHEYQHVYKERGIGIRMPLASVQICIVQGSPGGGKGIEYS
jgi:hypothetical protein